MDPEQARRDKASAAQAAMAHTIDQLGKSLQHRVFVDQVKKFCGEESQELKNCRLANNKNTKAACLHIEQLLDTCTQQNVRLVSDFRQTCRKQIARQEECIGGVFKPKDVDPNTGKLESCNEVITDFADCIGMGWTRREKKENKPTLLDSLESMLKKKE